MLKLTILFIFISCTFTVQFSKSLTFGNTSFSFYGLDVVLLKTQGFAPNIYSVAIH